MPRLPIFAWLAVLLGGQFLCLAQTQAPVEEVRIKDRQAHQQKVELVRTVQDEKGQAVTVTNSYVQLENGLNYRDNNGNWTETKPEFELVQNGAIAWKGQHKVSLAGDLNTAGAIQLRLPDGRLMEGHVLGLAYYDTSTGDSALIATVKDSQGWLVTANQITYPDAFEGAVADVRYTFSRSGFEQDVILREQPPAPEKFGMSSASTRLEVWTEFLPGPEPNETARQASLKGKNAGEEDESLEFGSMHIEEGRSFLLGEEAGRTYSVQKSWIKSANGRKFLVEAVELPAIATDLNTLPASREGVVVPAKGRSRLQALNELPAKERRASAQTAMHRMETRKDMVAAYQKPGFVLDYQFTLLGDQTAGQVLASDTTYFVSGTTDLFATTYLEGGCVIKFDKTAGSVQPKLYIRGTLVCKTSGYRPAIFTAKDDDSVGAKISGSTGSPGTDLYAFYPIRFYNAPSARLEHVRIRNAATGVSFHNTDANVVYTVAHAQIVNCQQAFFTTTVNTINVHNVLIDNVLTGGKVFAGPASPTGPNAYNGEHVTIHGAPSLVNNTTLSLKNSLIVQVATVGSYTGSGNTQGNQELSSDAGLFESAGGGYHYLPTSSPHRNAGTATIDATLAAELKQMTTEAPLVQTAAISTWTVLKPRVFRDVDVPDRGYHYSILDYLLNGVTLTSRLTLDEGVAVAVAGGNGLSLGAGSQLVSEGRAEHLNVLTRYNVSQERALTGDMGGPLLKISANYSPRPSVSLRFTEMASCNNTTLWLDSAFYRFASLTLESCQLRNVTLSIFPDDSSAVDVTFKNNLFERCYVSLNKSGYSLKTPLTVNCYNNLFWNGNLLLTYSESTVSPTWTFRDNLLDGVTNSLTAYPSAPVTRGYNGFTTGTTTTGATTFYLDSTDKTGLSADYQAGPLGAYYLPLSSSGTSLAALRNAGSRTAAAAGLFHYATDFEQAREGSTTVDIGFHYVATESYQASSGFATTQGANGWWYMSAPLQGLADGYLSQYSATSPAKWYQWTTGNDEFCRVEALGSCPGIDHDVVRRFVSPYAGKAWITGTNVHDPTGGDGVSVRIGQLPAGSGTTVALKNWTTVASGASAIMSATTRVGIGDAMDFQVNKISTGSYDFTKWNPVIAFDVTKDTDRDGLPDYLEDRNGNGGSTPDTGETDWDNVVNGANQLSSSPLIINGSLLELTSNSTLDGYAPRVAPDGTIASWLGTVTYSSTYPTRLTFRAAKPQLFGLVLPSGLGLGGSGATQTVVRTSDSTSVATCYDRSATNALDNILQLDFSSTATPTEIQQVLQAVRTSYPTPVSTVLKSSVEISFSCAAGTANYTGRREVSIVPANKRPKLILTGVNGERVVRSTDNASFDLKATLTDGGGSAPRSVYWQVFKGHVHYNTSVPADFHVYSYGEESYSDISGQHGEQPDQRQSRPVTTVNGALESQATFTLPLIPDALTEAYSVYRVRATATDDTSLTSDEIDVYVSSALTPSVAIRPMGSPALNQALTFSADPIGTYTGSPTAVWTIVAPNGVVESRAASGSAFTSTSTFSPNQYGRYLVRCEVTFDGAPGGVTHVASATSTFAVCEAPNGAADIVFVLDTSGSTTWAAFPSRFTVAFEIQSAFRRALKELDPARHRVGVVSFNSAAKTETGLGEPFDNSERIVSGLVADGGTMLGKGLQEAIEVFKGDPAKRSVERVIFILTDGYPEDLKAAEYWAALAKSTGIRVVAVAVPGGSAAALQQVVSRPRDAVQADFLTVGETVRGVLSSLCDHANAAPVASIREPLEIWEGVAAPFHVDATDDNRPVNAAGQHVGLAYRWSVTPAATVPTGPHGADVDIVFNAPGKYQVTVEVSENVASGALKDYATRTVVVRPKTDVLLDCFLVYQTVHANATTIFPNWSYDGPPPCVPNPTAGCAAKFDFYNQEIEAGEIQYTVWQRTATGWRLSSYDELLRVGDLLELQKMFGGRLSLTRERLLSDAKYPELLWRLNAESLPILIPNDNNDGFSWRNYRVFSNDGLNYRYDEPDYYPTPGIATWSEPQVWAHPAYQNEVGSTIVQTQSFDISRSIAIKYGPPWLVSAGLDQPQSGTLDPGVDLTLTATKTDRRADPVTGYTIAWATLEKPAGSTVTTVSGGTTLTPTFRFSQVGRYNLQVTLSKDGQDSASDEVEVVVGTTTLDMAGPDVVPFNLINVGTNDKVIEVVDVNETQPQPDHALATFVLAATLSGSPAIPANVTWTFALKPDDAPAPTITPGAPATSCTFRFDAPGLYEVRAICSFGVVRRQVMVNAAPKPQVYGLAGSSIEVPAAGALAVALVPDDDGAPSCSVGGATVAGGRCLQFHWSRSNERIHISDPHSPTPRITLSGSAVAGEPDLTLTLDVFDGQLTGRRVVKVENKGDMWEDHYGKRLPLPAGQDELVIPVVTGQGNDQGQIIWVDRNHLRGTIEIMPGGRSLVYRRPAGPICNSTGLEGVLYAIQDGTGQWRYETLSIVLLHNLTPADYEVVERAKGNNQYRLGWPKLISTLSSPPEPTVIAEDENVTVDGGSTPITQSKVKIYRRGCGLVDDREVDYTLFAVEETATTSRVEISNVMLGVKNRLQFTVTPKAEVTSGQGTTLRALLRTSDNVIVSWPISITFGNSTQALVVGNNARYKDEVRVGEMVKLDPQFDFGGIPTYTVNWSITTPPLGSGVAGAAAFMDATSLLQPRLAFVGAGAVTVDCAVTVGSTTYHQYYDFTVMESSLKATYVGQMYEVDPDDLPAGETQFCVKVESSEPTGASLRTVPAGIADADQTGSPKPCPGAMLVTRGVDPTSESGVKEPINLVPEKPGVYVVSITPKATPSAVKFIVLRVAPASEMPLGGSDPVLAVDSLQSPSGTAPSLARRYHLSSKVNEPTILRESGPFELLGTISDPSKLYEVRLERLDNGLGYYLPYTGGGVPLSSPPTRVTFTSTGGHVFASFALRDIPNGDYKLTVAAFDNGTTLDYRALEERYLSLRVPRHNGHFEFSRTDAVIGTGESAIKIERVYNSTDALGAGEDQSNNQLRLGSGWRISSPVVQLQLLEKRTTDPGTGANIRDDKSSRDLVITPSGAAEGIRYHYGGDYDPYWASEEGVGLVKPLPIDVSGMVVDDEDDLWDGIPGLDDSRPSSVGRYTWLLARSQDSRRGLDEFDFAGFQWLAPGGAHYIFERGEPQPRPPIPYADGRTYDTYTYPAAPKLSSIQLTDGSTIVPKDVALAGTDTAVDLEVYPAGATTPSRRVRLEYHVNSGRRQLIYIRQANDAGTFPTTDPLVTYNYGTGGQLDSVVRTFTLTPETGSPTTVTETETYEYDSARPQLVKIVKDSANRTVLKADYDDVGQLMFTTDVTGVIQSYRVAEAGGGDGLPPGVEHPPNSNEPILVETVYTPIGNLTVAQYAGYLDQHDDTSVTKANWIKDEEDLDNFYVKTETFNPNQASLPRLTRVTVPGFTVTTGDLATITVPAMTKVITRTYDDEEEVGGSAIDSANSVRSGRRLMKESVQYAGDSQIWNTEYAYGNSDLPITIKKPDGTVEHTVYNQQNQVEQQGPGGLMEFPSLTDYTTYDEATGQITSSTDARGLVHKYIYEDGRLNSVREENANGDLVGTETRYVYAANSVSGRWRAGDLILTVVSGHDGDSTTTPVVLSVSNFEYDGQGRQVVSRNVRVPRVTSNYDSAGQLSSAITVLNSDDTIKTTARAATVRTRYDESGRVVQTEEQEEKVSGTDGAGNQLWVAATTDLIRTNRNVYDALGRLEATIDVYGKVTRYYYDLAGNRIQTVLPELSLGGEVAVTRTLFDINRRPILTQKEFAFATLSDATTTGSISDSGATRTVYDGFGRTFYTENLLKLKLKLEADGSSTVGTRTVYYYKLSVVTDTDSYHANAANRLNRTENHYDATDALRDRLEWRETDGSQETYAVTSFRLQTPLNPDQRLRYTYAGFVQLSRAEGILPYLPVAIGSLEQTSKAEVDSAGRQLSTAAKIDNQPDEQRTEYRYNDPVTWADTPDVHQVISAPTLRVTAAGVMATGTLWTDDAPQAITTTEYDLKGQATRVTDPAGGITDKTYDALGRLTSVKQELGSSDPLTLYRYDEAGNLVWRRDAQSRVTFDKFDYLGRRVERASPAVTSGSGVNSGVETWTYDEIVGSGSNQTWKRKLVAVDLAGWSMQQDFDARGRLTVETPLTGGAGSTAGNSIYEFSYVKLAALPGWIPNLPTGLTGQMASKRIIVEKVNDTSTYLRTNTLFYDGAGRLRAKGTPEGTICYTYDDVSGRLARIQAYRSSYTVNSSGNETWGGETYNGPDTTIKRPDVDTSYTYDYAGRLVAAVDNRLLHRTTHRARLGSIATLTSQNSAHGLNPGMTVTITGVGGTGYDGTFTVIETPTSKSFTYDCGFDSTEPSVADSTGVYGVDDRTTTYVYEEGRLVGQRYPNGVTTIFKHDPLGDVSDIEFHRKDSAGLSLTDITETGAALWNATPRAWMRYARDYSGQRRRSLETLPKAGAEDFATSGTQPLRRQFQHQYDSAHRLHIEWISDSLTPGTSFNSMPLGSTAKMDYTVGLAGNRSDRTRSSNGGGTDPLGSLVAPNVSSYTYDPQDRPITVVGSSSSLSPTWDARGNALNPGYGTTYEWDRRNRLVTATATATSVTTTFGYDAEGLLVSKKVGTGVPTRYLVDSMNPTGYAQVLAEYTDDGPNRAPVRLYTYGLDLISQRTFGSGLVEYFSTDVLGSTRFLTKFDPGSGGTADGHLGELTSHTFSYDAYGLLATGSGNGTSYMYTGERWHNEVGGYYLRARWYLPEWGRFLSRDTYEGQTADPISQNRFLYSNANPVKFVDPSGHTGDANSTMVAVGNLSRVAAQYIARMPGAARTAFGLGGSFVAKYFQQFGTAIQNFGDQVIELIPTVQRLEPVLAGFSRRPDWLLRIGNALRLVEGKYQLPRAGEALARLGSQLQQFTQWATQEPGREVVVWALKNPENVAKAEAAVLQAAGNPQGVRFVYGIEGLFQYLSH